MEYDRLCNLAKYLIVIVVELLIQPFQAIAIVLRISNVKFVPWAFYGILSFAHDIGLSY